MKIEEIIIDITRAIMSCRNKREIESMLDYFQDKLGRMRK